MVVSDGGMKGRVKGLLGTPPAGEAAAPMEFPSEAAAQHQALQVLTLAQRTAEEILSDPQMRADEVAKDAQARADARALWVDEPRLDAEDLEQPSPMPAAASVPAQRDDADRLARGV